MTLEEIETLARAVQAVVTALALLVAGAWAIYTFRALGQVARSRAEIQKFEREARIGAVVEISIRTSQHTRPDDPDAYVSAVVEIENKGIRNTRLEYGKDRRPFRVFSVERRNDGSLRYELRVACPVPVSTAPAISSPSTVIRAGGREKLPFYFRVSSPGVYLLVFTAPTSEEERAVGEELGLRFPGNWMAMEYLVVERPNGDHPPTWAETVTSYLRGRC